jgi:uncharacterized protein YqgC (DUF456 family)
MDLSAWNLDLAWVYYPSVAVLVVLCVAAWLTSLFTLPGNWFVVALAAGFAWLFPHEAGRGVGWTTVGAAIGLAALGEVIEFAAGAAGAAKQGASRRAILLALVGAMVGSIAGVLVGSPVPVLGSFIMALLGGAGGAFAGAYLGEMWKGRTVDERIAAGQGAFVGKIWGTLGKLVCGAVIIAVVTADALI